MLADTYVDKHGSLVVDSLEIELDLVVVPFSRNVEFGPEPRILDRAVLSQRSLNTYMSVSAIFIETLEHTAKSTLEARGDENTCSKVTGRRIIDLLIPPCISITPYTV